MVNLSNKFDIYVSNGYEDIKSHAKCRKWSGLRVKGHSRSPQGNISIDRAHTSSC